MIYVRLLSFTLLLIATLSACQTPRHGQKGYRTPCPILMYHHVAPQDECPPSPWTVTPETFERQLLWLSQAGYTVIPLSALSAHFDSGTPLPPHPVVITFDDGWDDQLRYAVPILTRLGFTASFFVCSELIDRKLDGYMSWNELLELTTAGMSVQSHTMSHPHLKELPAVERMEEIAGSRSRIYERLGISCDFIAWPYGNYDESDIERAILSGYRGALSCNDGILQSTDSRFRLRRLLIEENDDQQEFLRKLKTGQTRLK